MDNKGILLRLFEDFTEKKFSPTSVDDRIIMQKIIFFLDELGITVGDYNFALETYGPFSQNLNNDLHEIKKAQIIYQGDFPDYLKNAIIFLKKEIFKKRLESFNYDLRVWLEAIASLVYLKKYMYPTVSVEDNLSRLKKLKPYLKDEEANKAVKDCCVEFLQYSIKA